MEAVPRLPMISFHLKVSPEPTSFGPKLKQYIRDFYNEDGESYANEIHQLECLRAMAIRPPIDMTGCSLLKKYYCQLHFLQGRFAMEKDGACAVTFTWRDTYANMVCSMANIRFEIISILYNIGAMHTQLGARMERTTAEGMKMACAHFQCAAWAFENLKNSFPQPPGVDLAPELMTFMHQLCLAQAQECILEKSMLDNRKPTIVAKVARQIVDYYGLALGTLEQGGNDEGTVSDTVGSKIYKSWKRYVKFKRAYHLAVTQLYQGLAAEEQQKMGERVAFYNAALAALNEARSLNANAKGSAITNVPEEKEAMEDALTFTNDVIEGKRKAAKNENEFIYHEEVPERESLPTVKGASLVKGISFNINDPEVSGPDIFARLVPMTVHEASSLYSEEKAKILRSVGTKIEERDQQLVAYLSSLKLDHLNLWDPDRQGTEPDIMPLPEELAERCAALNAKPDAIRDLVDAMGKLADTYHDVESMLKEIDQILSEEQLREKRYQQAMGKRPPSIVATDLTREAKKYEEAHTKASESNQALHRAMTLHVNNLKILAQPLADLTAHVPSPKACIAGLKDGEKRAEADAARELIRILGKTDEMRMQRSELHAQLRDSIAQDDITLLLVTATVNPTPLDRLFAEQIGKHQKFVSLIEQNLAAQDNILSALTDAYARTAETRKTIEDAMKRREATITSLVSSYDAYEDLLAKSTKGLEFYRKLETNVTKLLQRVKSTCKVQEEEREHILARNNKTPENASAPPGSAQQPATTGSGLKLKDYLASRQKTAAGYANQYYDRQMGHVEQPAKPSVDREATPPVSELPPANPNRYYPGAYTDYYAGQQVGYAARYPYAESAGVDARMQSYENANSGGNLSQGFPKSGTTNTESMYRQAGGTSATMEVASNSARYAGYVAMQDGQAAYLGSNVSGQYGASAQSYDPRYAYQPQANVAIDYYGVAQQQPNAQYPSDFNQSMAESDGVRNVEQNHYPSSLRQDIMPGNMSADQSQPPVSRNASPHQNPYIGNTATAAATGVVPHSYQNQVPQIPRPSENLTPQNYQMIAGSTEPAPQTYQPTFQPQPMEQNQQTASQPQSVHPAQVASTATHYASPEQYVQARLATVKIDEVPGSHAAGNDASAYAASVQASYQPPQSYADNSTIMSVGQMTQNYGGTYAGFPQSLPAHGYQQQDDPSTISVQSYANYSNDSEMIQSHAKSSSILGYAQDYQYPVQNQYLGAVQYQNYAQSYGSGYAAPQVTSVATPDSYKGHPGYAYDPVSGIYQYSSGYQDSRTSQMQAPGSQSQEPPASSYEHQEPTSRYTNASSDITTSQTSSSQYSNQSFQLPTSTQAYYTLQYGQQVQQGGAESRGSVNGSSGQPDAGQTYVQSANNETNTTASPPAERPRSSAANPKSNVDLLADLDITINHAPLVPEVHTTFDKVEKPEESENELSAELKPDVAEPETHGKEEKNENLQIVWDTWYLDVQPKKDPLGDSTVLQKFATDVEKYEKFIDGLLVKTLSGATTLDIKWKEISDFQEREAKKQTVKVALAHATENRSIECIPYDLTIVELAALPYVNASHVKDVTERTPAAFIVTQAPKSETYEAFWTMIWEQRSEVIACLASDSQLNGDIYWPTEDTEYSTFGDITLSLKSKVNHSTYIQRIFSLHHSKNKVTRDVVHMQFITWPLSGFPSSPGPLLAFTTDVLSEQALRHCSPRPIVVHCVTGGPLSGLFLLAAATVCHVRAGRGVVDVPLVFSTLVKFRRCLVDKESLLFGYRMVLYHAQDTLMKRGILSSSRSTFEGFDGVRGSKGLGRRKTQQRHPSEDFLHNLGVGQGNASLASTNANAPQSATPADFHEKMDDAKPVDPLSQLDPMWSIRR